jgi:hypothetical protein
VQLGLGIRMYKVPLYLKLAALDIRPFTVFGMLDEKQVIKINIKTPTEERTEDEL